MARFLRDQVTADKFTATGQRLAFAGQVVDGTKPFRVTIAWTDAPGNTTGNAYNNDLDLVVNIGGTFSVYGAAKTPMTTATATLEGPHRP